ncbi:MAG: hypothetical protein LBQ93_03750 [Treponema sp.]|jgi:hypothetical protein|nr:hypothetical protein [Treponema sp.]
MKKILFVFVLIFTVCLFGCNKGVTIPEEFRGRWYDLFSLGEDGEATCEIFKDRITFFYLRKFLEDDNPFHVWENARHDYFVGKSFYPVSLESYEGKKAVLFELPDYYDTLNYLPENKDFDASKYSKVLLKVEQSPNNLSRLELSTYLADNWAYFCVLHQADF